jgi:hypothetical protein
MQKKLKLRQRSPCCRGPRGGSLGLYTRGPFFCAGSQSIASRAAGRSYPMQCCRAAGSVKLRSLETAPLPDAWRGLYLTGQPGSQLLPPAAHHRPVGFTAPLQLQLRKARSRRPVLCCCPLVLVFSSAICLRCFFWFFFSAVP